MMIQNFKALELKFEDSSVSHHYIYIKEHSVRETSALKPHGRTLFVLNIPPYVDEQGLKNAFADAGVISSILFTEKPSKDSMAESVNLFKKDEKEGFRVGYIVFEKVSYLDKALNLEKLQPISIPNYKPKIGMKKWIQQYNAKVPIAQCLNLEIKTFIENFDQKQKEIKDKDELSIEDDEGWISVTKKGKVNSFARSEKIEKKIIKKELLGKQRKELQNFYTFQIRESKMKSILAMRQKFDEDKKKIAQLKQNRRFKPF